MATRQFEVGHWTDPWKNEARPHDRLHQYIIRCSMFTGMQESARVSRSIVTWCLTLCASSPRLSSIVMHLHVNLDDKNLSVSSNP